MSAWPAQKLDIHEKKGRQSKPAFESFLDVLQEGAFSDVTFIVGPTKERIPCHQLFLRARSPVFQVMFSDRWNQESNKEVPLEDVDPKIFRMFLQYIYADTLEATVSEALALLQVADEYDVQLLVRKCEKLLESEVTLDNALDVFEAARKYERVGLMDKVGDFVAKSMFKFECHPSFSRVDKQFFMYMLRRNDLKMTEVNLFRLALQWAKNQVGSTEEQSLEHILPLIRFPTMTPNEFTTTVVPSGLLSQSQLLELYTYFGSDAETKKSMASTLKFSTERRRWVEPEVALYSRDFHDCKFKRERYKELTGRVEFNIYNLRGAYGMFSTLYALLSAQPQTKKIALYGLSIYCPTKGKCSNWEQDSNATKTFKIVVTAKHSYDTDFKKVRAFPNVEVPEGKMREVEFVLPIPLDSQQRYRITVKETGNGQTDTAQEYEVRDFGDIQRRVTTAVGESWVYVRNIRDDRSYNSLFDYHTSAQLICKLGVKEV